MYPPPLLIVVFLFFFTVVADNSDNSFNTGYLDTNPEVIQGDAMQLDDCKPGYYDVPGAYITPVHNSSTPARQLTISQASYTADADPGSFTTRYIDFIEAEV